MRPIFLSYARSDDEPFVKRLHADLTDAGFDVWFDRVSLPARRLTFHQEIKDAIRQRDCLIYIAGPKAAVSDYVQEECRFAFECDKPVIPILRKGDFDVVPGELCLVHCEDFRDDAQYLSQLAKLVANLNRPEPPLGKLFAVPSLPPYFLARPAILRRLKDAVRTDRPKEGVITSRIGLQGMGGIGKSVLATAVARDREIRRCYPDGVIWISFRQNLQSQDIMQLMRDVARHLDDPGQFDSIAQGEGVLRKLLLTRAVLLVLDNVWNAVDCQPFDVLGPGCRALVTTRDAGILRTLHGAQYPVDLLTEAEALFLLASAIETTADQLPREAREVVRECGCLPLAVALCGGMAKKREGDWDSILQRLRRADLEKIADRQAINEQHRSIYHAMQASVEVLAPEEQIRFAEFSVFMTMTGQGITESAIVTLWARTAKLGELDTEDLLINLSERALIRLDREDVETPRGFVYRVSLHDLLYDFAGRLVVDKRALHQALLDAYRPQCPSGWHTGPHDGYFFRHICRHLAAAKENWDESADMLCDLRFIDARCLVGEVFELWADYCLVLDSIPEARERVKARREQEVRVARWTNALIVYARAWRELLDRRELEEPVDKAGPVLPDVPVSCRLWADEEIEKERRRILKDPTRFDRLTAFAAFVRAECYPLLELGERRGFVLQHAWGYAPSSPVRAAAATMLQDDPPPVLLRRWWTGNIHNPTPVLLATLEGHREPITSVRVTPDGRRAVSGGLDKTLRVWDLESGACLHILEHTSRVLCVDLTPDGMRAFSGTGEGTLHVWDLENGVCLGSLEKSGGNLRGLSVTPDGRRAISATGYQFGSRTLGLWDLERGVCLRTLVEHVGIFCVSMTPDSRRAISGAGGTLHVWDLKSGACLHTLAGHIDRILSVSMTPDGRRAISGGKDKTLRVWDLESGVCLHTLSGHLSAIRSVSTTPDGRHAISAGEDGRLFVWDVENGRFFRDLEGHRGPVTSVSVTFDGRRAISGSVDGTVRIWNLENGLGLHQGGHYLGDFNASCVSTTPECRYAVSGTDGSISHSDTNVVFVWDLEIEDLPRSLGCDKEGLMGHSAGVTSVSLTANGRRAVSASRDGTLRLWDLRRRVFHPLLRTFEGHRAEVNCVVTMRNGRRAVSGSKDGTLRIWNLSPRWLGSKFLGSLKNGKALLVLKGHPTGVNCVSVLPDGRHAVSGAGWRSDRDCALRLWDLENGACLRTFEGHSAGVRSVSVTPDGGRAVSASWDKTLRVWDLQSGDCLRVLAGHSADVTSVSVMPDGRHAVSGSTDKTLRLWDLESGQCLTMSVTPAAILAVASAGCGNPICVGTDGPGLLFYDVYGIDLGAITGQNSSCRPPISLRTSRG